MDTTQAAMILENLFIDNAMRRADELVKKGDVLAAEAVRKDLVARRNQMLVDAFGSPKPAAVIQKTAIAA